MVSEYAKQYSVLWHEIVDDWFWHVGEPEKEMTREEMIKQLWGLEPPEEWNEPSLKQQILTTYKFPPREETFDDDIEEDFDFDYSIATGDDEVEYDTQSQ
jgi:hypothetical protein